jgi:hypothetical protein
MENCLPALFDETMHREQFKQIDGVQNSHPGRA